MSLFRCQSALFHQNRLSSYLKYLSRRQFYSSPASSTPKDSTSRLRKLNDRLPSFLRAYTTPLLGAPGTHITSFLILHEITAIVPLFGLVTAFHYGNWLPDLTSSSAFEEGTRRFGRWLRKKGWVEDVDMDAIEVVGSVNSYDPVRNDQMAESDRKGVRLVLEFATAYAVTKALLPLRIAASVWATPWFARVILVPTGKGLKKLLGRK
ncbi:hypothetical protein F9C07_2283723 [Aspergillus flavus]|uniref:Uncharacterized protein n=3 Tax=Aspergillus subgen. Circumdati TaxID=2720871 RepID=B8NQE9_ASPFN|nr:uncharacterized protein G4B84_006863 [Aspergillus flavus NRRL3357]KAJ1707690.1 hypothetical protein NYO67_10167 [Aspergillus flavus]OOO11755.1 hypothetical protein OAory_01082250 [Aspergillus oryzae]KAF7621692.1 hypothetical protein AFLA_011984 [Aspergillus flavus NRRL3357]QMW31482.1 hypothetical protein G4B84_006863 [Aspergillus flavus NRRL3357]QMW43540.1 hypothetical protein G4B11_006910 [Aspergillus flavus]